MIQCRQLSVCQKYLEFKILSIKMLHLLLIIMLLTSCADVNPTNNSEIVDKTENKNSENMHLTTNNYIRDIANHPAYKGFGELLLSRDNNVSYYNIPLSDVGSLMPYHSNVRPDVVLDALNYMIDEVNREKTIFYDFYTEQQKQQHPAKRNTGIFFFRGNSNSPFAVVCPGGGFSYVGSLHEGFPLAQRISELGLNAFVIRYRIGSEQHATEDLAAAITFIMRNAEMFGVSDKSYSV
jgi:hypothetical protein